MKKDTRKMSIGENIKRYRDAKGLSQEKLAEEIGLHICKDTLQNSE